MVTKKDLEDLNDSLTANFKKMLTESIDELKNNIIDNLKKSNESLQLKVSTLEKEVLELKQANVDYIKGTEAALQHGRLEQIIISGIPNKIHHDDLERTSLGILNQIKEYKMDSRDIAACHRIGKQNDTILRFVNRKDADDCLGNRKKLRTFNRESVGLDPGTDIYLNENLCPFMRKLAFY